jgi:enoyl-CoA hydratase
MVLEVDVDESTCTALVTLNRPEQRNALSPDLLAAIDDAVIELDRRDDIATIILTGADPAFCAGFDLRRLATETPSAQEEHQSSPVEHFGLLPDHETPIIGAINGPAVTGGLELALSCDFLVASERASFADTHARVGAMPGGGLTIRLPQLIGINRARQMSFTGDFVSAEQAVAWGLVNEVVPHDRLLTRARQVAAAIGSIPIANVREVRRMYAEIGELHGLDAYRRENRWAREWMADRFDRARLTEERKAIIERGRSQT